MKAVKRSESQQKQRFSLGRASAPTNGVGVVPSSSRRRTAVLQANVASPPTTLNLRGIDIEFPFKPYKCQEDYMTKVIDSLIREENALLESPTGTGKTLCLLCATLAWQREYFRRTKADDFVPNNKLKQPYRIPTIIYASRTHSQISQVVKELRSTRYRPKHALLGSREQMCVNPKVKKSTSTSSEINHDCNKLGMERKCRFRNKLENYGNGGIDPQGHQPVRDMEDLILMGNENKVCPFYFSRNQVENAELIFLPYNYLFDKDSRSTTLSDVPWDNAVVIFDEAHNLESFASESASFDLTSLDIAGCVGEVQRAMSFLEVMGGTDDRNIKKDNLIRLKSLFLRMENYIMNLGNKTSYRGEFMMDIFQKQGITHANHHLFLGEARKLTDIFMEMSGGNSCGAPRLEHFVSCVKQVFGEPTEARCIAKAQSYRVHVSPKNGKSSAATGSSGNGYGNRRDAAGGGRTISYWCFAPAEAMRELENLNVRSILVTSGTLSPLDSYALELDLPFPHRLENPHIIPDDQIHVRVIGKGVSGKLLTSSYERRQDEEYYTELGNTLVSLGKIVPGGMLIFFPSYSVMETCLEKWGGPVMGGRNKATPGNRNNNFFAARKRQSAQSARYSYPHSPNTFSATREPSNPWKRLLGTKAVVIEPRSSSDLPDAISEFQRFLSLPKSTGVALLGVCRGKISEGIDFAHDMCRAVVITGLPFAPSFDPKVKMKREFLDQARAMQNAKPADNGGFDSNKPKVVSLSGHEWYTQQAHRSVNQAIGRTIRNKIDYGAILLLDSRFSQPGNQAGLSKWVRPHILPDEGVGRAIGALAKFYKSAEAKARKREKETPPPPPPNEVSIILKYEDEGKENLESSNEEEISKIAVVAQDEEGGASSDKNKECGTETLSPDKTYVPPDRIVTRIDMNEKEGAKKMSALISEMTDESKKEESGKDGSKKDETVTSATATTEASDTISSTPGTKCNTNQSTSSVVVKLNTPGPSTAKSKLSGGSPSMTIAKRFFKQVQETMSAPEQSMVKKSVVSMKKFKESSQMDSFVKEAGNVINVILAHEGFEGKAKDEKPELFSMILQLIPKQFLVSVQQRTMYLILKQAEFHKIVETEVTDPSLHKKQYMDSGSFIFELWFGKKYDDNSRYVQKLKVILEPLRNAKLNLLLSTILQVIPLEKQQITKAFFEQLKASLNISRMKGREKKQQRGEDAVNSSLFRRRPICQQIISDEGGPKKSLGRESLTKATETMREGQPGCSTKALKKEDRLGANSPYKRSEDKTIDSKACRARDNSHEEPPQKFRRGLSLSSLVSKKVKTSNGDRKSVKRILEEVTASETYAGISDQNTANKLRSIPQSDFTCTLCSCQSKTPVISECGHLGCGDCWTKWLKKNEGCFACRAPVSKETLARAVFKK